jgi:ribose 1,5-bisphosphokinase PhnN
MAAIVARGKLIWRGHMDDVDVPATIDALLAGGDVVVVRLTVAGHAPPPFFSPLCIVSL